MKRNARAVRKPAFIIRQGSSIVRAYKFKSASPARTRFCLYYRKHAGAAPTRETCTGEKNARGRATQIAIALANGRADVLELSNIDRDSYLHAKSLLPPSVPLHVAIEEWIELRRQQASMTIQPEANQILAEMLADLADHQRSDRHIKGLRHDLEPFARAFPHLHEATEMLIADYLRQTVPASSPRRRDNVRDAIVQLSRFARRRNYLPEDRRSAAEKIGKIKSGHDVQTWSTREASLLLEHVAPRWLPWLALGLFAGLRTSEILRLDWASVKFEQRIISVPRRVARKIRISRIISMSDNLLAWLAPVRGSFGAIYPGNFKTNENEKGVEMNRLRKLLGLPRRDNANRHSFGSYRLAIVKSYEQLAVEMGNSPRKVREDYNDPKPEADGTEFFALNPPAESANVLALEFR